MGKNTQRTLTYLKDKGYRCGNVEFWNPHTRQRYDLFGFLDIIALDAENGRTIGVQSFGADFQPHWRKITEEKRTDAILWLMSGNQLMLIGWTKMSQRNEDNTFATNKDGTRKKLKKWVPRIHMMTLEDFNEGVVLVTP